MSNNGKELSTVLSSEIASDIDFKLTKQDVIDLVVEEKRTELEKLIAAKNVELLALADQYHAIAKAFDEYLMKHAKAQTKSIAAFLKKQKCELTYAVQRDYASLSYLVSCTQSNGQRYRNRGDEQQVTRVNLTTLAQKDFRFAYVSVRTKNRNDHDESGMSMYAEGTICAEKAEHEKLAKSLQPLVTAHLDLCAEIKVAQEEAASLTGMGRKAKAALIKRILESSGSGKSILASLSAVRASLQEAIAVDVAPKAQT